MADPIFVDSPAPPKGGPVFVDDPAPSSKGAVPALHPGMSDDDVIRAFGYDPNKIKNVSGYQPGMFSKGITDPNGFAAKYILPSIVGGIGHGVSEMKDAYEQAKQHIWGAITGDTSGVDFANLVHAFKNADYNQNWRHRAPGETGFDPSTLIPQAGLAAMVPGGGLKVPLQGAVMALSTPTEGNGNFAQQKTTQALTGAAGAMGGQIAGEKIITPALQKFVGPVVNKVQNAVSGNLAPQYQEIQALADKYGVPISFTDAAQTPILKKTGAALNEIPLVGTGGFRVQQQQAAKAAAQDFAQGFKDAAPAGDWTDNLQGALKDKFQAVQAQKNALYGKVADAAGDAQIPLPKVNAALDAAESDINRSAIPNSQVLKTIQALRANLNPGRADTGQFTPKASDTTFTGLQLTRSDLGDAITGLLKSGQDKEAKVLMGVRNAMNQDMGNFAQGKSGVQSMVPQVLTDNTPNVENGFVRLYRAESPTSGFDDVFNKDGLKEFTTDKPGVRFTDDLKYAKYFQKSYGPDASLKYIDVPQSMANSSKLNNYEYQVDLTKNTGLAQAWKDADAFYKSQYVPLKSKAIQNAMKSATPDEIVNTFVQQGKGDRAANFYSALTPDGQASLRAGLVDRALQNATDGNTGVFSPAKFAGYFDKMDVPTSQIFKGEDKWALDGFTKLMRAVQPAGEMGAGPATGNRTILPGSIAAGITGAITMPHTTATMGGLTYGMSKLFTTNAGKRLLMAASDVPVGSPAMNKIVQQITTLLGAQEGAKSAIPLKALIPMAAQNDQLNQPLQITDLRPQVQP